MVFCPEVRHEAARLKSLNRPAVKFLPFRDGDPQRKPASEAAQDASWQPRGQMSGCDDWAQRRERGSETIATISIEALWLVARRRSSICEVVRGEPARRTGRPCDWGRHTGRRRLADLFVKAQKLRWRTVEYEHQEPCFRDAAAVASSTLDRLSLKDKGA